MILIGIDDTDNKESRGTGFLSRQLGKLIEANSLGSVKGITRHQLYVHEDIPFTSRNSSACLAIDSENMNPLHSLCRDYLVRNSADGSDAGLAIAMYKTIPDEIIDFGLRAKREILTRSRTKELAEKHNIILEGLTGTQDGIIGSLAAVGLRKYGNDGRFIWLQGKDLRDLSGICTVEKALEDTGIDSVVDMQGNIIGANEKINVGNWVRPVIRNNKVLLIAEKISNHYEYGWKIASKDYIKSISD